MKRGQSEFLSVGVIFSIIIIIFILSISIYVVTKFVGVGKCADISVFKDDFQDRVNTAWGSEIASDKFTGKVPNGIESVCFGNNPGTGREYQALKDYMRYEANMFFYPPENSCDQPYAEIEHLDAGGFVCFPVADNKVTIGIEKGSFDSLVKITNSVEESDGFLTAIEETNNLDSGLGLEEDFEFEI